MRSVFPTVPVVTSSSSDGGIVTDPNRCVFLGGLPPDATFADVREALQICGHIELLAMHGWRTYNLRAYVIFTTAQAAASAFANDIMVRGFRTRPKPISMSWHGPWPPGNAERQRPPPPHRDSDASASNAIASSTGTGSVSSATASSRSDSSAGPGASSALPLVLAAATEHATEDDTLVPAQSSFSEAAGGVQQVASDPQAVAAESLSPTSVTASELKSTPLHHPAVSRFVSLYADRMQAAGATAEVVAAQSLATAPSVDDSPSRVIQAALPEQEASSGNKRLRSRSASSHAE